MTNPGSLGHVAPNTEAALVRRITALEKLCNQLITQRTLESAIIGKGGITVKGGKIVIQAMDGSPIVTLNLDGMTVQAPDGTVLATLAGDGVTLHEGGDLTVNDGGTIKVNDGGALLMETLAGQTIIQANRINIPDGSGRFQQAIAFRRDDGSLVFAIADFGTTLGHAHHQNFGIYDRLGHLVFAEDANGNGLAVPYLGANFVDISVPAMTTTAGTFTPLQWSDIYLQHPQLSASILVQTPAGTAGEIRMTIGGVAVGSVTAVAANSFTQVYLGPGSVLGAASIGDRVIVQLEGRVTSGAGALAARGLGLWGVQA